MKFIKQNMDKELKFLLEAEYLSGKDMLKVIRKYQRCKDDVEKEKLKEIIFNNNIRMIRKEAARFAKHSDVDVEDLFGAGTVGFFEGLKRFKLSKKVLFSTYVKIWIDKIIYQCLHQQSILHIPRGDFYLHKERIQPYLNHSLLYLDAPILTEEGEGISDYNNLIPDNNALNVESEYLEKRKTECILKLVNKCLNERERFVIRSKFIDGKTNHEVGQVLGVVGQSVCNIQKAAIEKLQRNAKQFS